MKRLFFILTLLFASAICANATEITVGSSQWFAGSYRYAGTTATLRIYYSQSFLSNTNVNVVGSAVGSNGWYKNIACTISSSTLNCASFTLQSTVDSNKPNTRFFAVLYDQSGARRETLMGDASGWIVPASPTTTTVAILQNSQGTGIPNPPVSYLNSSQVQALINTAVGTLNDAAVGVKGRIETSVAPAVAAHPIAVETTDPRVNTGLNVASYGVDCTGITDTSTTLQSALDAAKAQTHVWLQTPPNCQMKIGTKITLSNVQTVTFGTTQPDGYSFGTGTARLVWSGASGGTMMDMLNCDGCRVSGLAFEMGTANVGLNVDTGGSGSVSSSDQFVGLLFHKATSDANTKGLIIAATSSNNNERMTLDHVVCLFGGSTTASNVNRGTCIQLGSNSSGDNLLNTVIISPYWYGASYGIDVYRASYTWVLNSESNNATIDYRANAAPVLTIVNPRSEQARQLLYNSNSGVSIEAGFAGNGSWDAAFSVIYAAGTGTSTTRLRQFDLSVQSGITFLDANPAGNNILDSDTNITPFTAAGMTANLNNFIGGVVSKLPGGLVGLFLGGTNGASIQMKGTTFANLAFVYSTALSTNGNGAFIFCTDCNVATPCTGGGAGAWAFRKANAWACPF